jgi:hypothetical protein
MGLATASATGITASGFAAIAADGLIMTDRTGVGVAAAERGGDINVNDNGF